MSLIIVHSVIVIMNNAVQCLMKATHKGNKYSKNFKVQLKGNQ